MSKIEEKYNERTGQIEVFLNDRRIDTLENDQTNIELEILKNLIDGLPGGDVEEQRNRILGMISHHLGDGNNSLLSIKDVLVDIYNKIGEGGSSEEIERVKRELLLLIELLNQKIEESKLVAGEGIVIKGNVISTTGGSYVDKLISDYEKLEQDFNKVSARNIKLAGEVSVLNDKLVRAEQENKGLTKELQQTTNKYEKSLIEITKLDTEVKRLEEIIASGEDYKMYKKYEQLYYQAQAEARKWHQIVEDLSGDTKRKQIRNQELNNQLRNEFCRCC